MITEHDLQEAIAFYQGKLDPNREDALYLAACFINQDHMFGKKAEQLPVVAENAITRGYSYAPPPEPVEITIDYDSDTAFGRMIHGRQASEIWPIIDELVNEAVQALNPRLYDAFMRKLKK